MAQRVSVMAGAFGIGSESVGIRGQCGRSLRLLAPTSHARSAHPAQCVE